MFNKDRLQEIFEQNNCKLYDFSKSPKLIKYKVNMTPRVCEFSKESLFRWRRAEQSFLRWTKDKSVFTKEYVDSGKAVFGEYFKNKGLLQGSVLDIGGGWGLFRQWWDPEKENVFVVHDPGVARFLRGPHKIHLDCYRRGFSLPMTFVEGFGEDLPYQDEIFDTCIIAAVLDHCIDPFKVLIEARRCLKTNGAMLIIQSCPPFEPKSSKPNFMQRFVKHALNPRGIIRTIYYHFFQPEHHMHHFVVKDIISLLERSHFIDIKITLLRGTQDIYAIEAKK